MLKKLLIQRTVSILTVAIFITIDVTSAHATSLVQFENLSIPYAPIASNEYDQKIKAFLSTIPDSKFINYPDPFPVPKEKQKWSVQFKGYNPVYYTNPDFLGDNRPSFADDEVKPVNHKKNPWGRTGIEGRGNLPRWEINKFVEPIITTRNAKGELVVLSVLREGPNETQWGLPGSFLHDGERIRKASSLRVKEKTGIDLDFSNAKRIYKGFVNDPRNTDDAWVETTALHLHLDPIEAEKINDDLLPSNSEGQMIAWVPVREDKIDFYANHEDILTELINITGMKRKIAFPLEEKIIESNSIALQYANKINFTALNYDSYFKKVKFDILSLRSRNMRKKFEDKFMKDLIDAVKDHYKSQDWRSHVPPNKELRRDYIRFDEHIHGKENNALFKNGFFESDYFLEQIIAPNVLHNYDGNLKPILLTWDENDPFVKQKESALKEAKILMIHAVTVISDRYIDGKVTIKGLSYSRFIRFLFSTFALIIKKTPEEFFKRVLRPLAITVLLGTLASSGFDIISGSPGGFDAEYFTKFFTIIGIAFAGVYGLEFGVNRSRDIVDYFKHILYERDLKKYILETDPAQDKRQYKYYFEKILKKTSKKERSLIKSAKNIVRKKYKKTGNYLRTAETGVSLASSPLSTDAKTIITAMFKELAEDNTIFFNGQVEKWEKKVRRYDRFWKIWQFISRSKKPRPKTTRADIFLELKPLAHLQRRNHFLKNKVNAEFENLSKNTKNDASDEVIEKRKKERLIELRTIKKLESTIEFLGFLFNEIDNLPNPEQRRLVIISYVMGGTMARLRSIAQNLRSTGKTHARYRKHVHTIIRKSILPKLEKIRSNPEFYGFDKEENKEWDAVNYIEREVLRARIESTVYSLSVQEALEIQEEFSEAQKILNHPITGFNNDPSQSKTVTAEQKTLTAA